METKNINGMTILTASEGKILRNGDNFSETVVLGKYDSADNYKEVDRSEYDSYVKEQQAYQEKEDNIEESSGTLTMPTPSLADAIAAKLARIRVYDNSDAVNSFTLGGVQMWIDFEERARIRQSIDAYRNVGKTEMTKWFNGKSFTYPLDTWQAMLDKLSVYASEALNVTEQHKAEVKALTTVEDVEAYDITKGYPAKLLF